MAEMFPNNMMEGGGPPAPEADDGKMIQLCPGKIEMKDCYARNENTAHPMSNLFIGDSTLGCKSDTDEQLILHISFQEFVKIRSIMFTEYNNGLDPESNPSTVHLYVNRDNLGFEDIDDIDPTQTITLSDEQLKNNAEPIPLKFVKFQRVKTLTIYIADNNGGDITALGAIKLLGKPIETVNMKNFKAQQPQG